jgi:hypothetical protein
MSRVMLLLIADDDFTFRAIPAGVLKKDGHSGRNCVIFAP